MTYCTKADVRFVSNLKENEYSNTNVDLAIEKAETEINAKLSKNFTVPFSPVPPKVRWMSADLAASFCLSNTYIGTAPNETPYAQILYDRVHAQLDRILAGDEQLVDEDGTEEPTLSTAQSGSGVKSNTSGCSAVFSRCDVGQGAECGETDSGVLGGMNVEEHLRLHITGENLSSQADNSKVKFVTTYVFQEGSVKVFVNGLREINFTETGLNEITLDNPPETDDVVLVDYIKKTR